MTVEQTERLQMRVSKSYLKTVDDWRRKQPDLPSRSEAIRRLVELGLTVETRAAKPTQARGRKAAGEQLDRMADQGASSEQQAGRKRRLMEGPKEFREMREKAKRD